MKKAKCKRIAELPINNLVVISDLHSGCQFGLCPPNQVRLDGGGHYLPNQYQLKIWDYWQFFWNTWLTDKEVLHNEPFAVVLNGDALDGVHHGAKTQVSQNIADQVTIARLILEPVVGKCQGRFYYVRGTESHSGKSSEYEEMLAQQLGAVQDENGRYSRDELYVRLNYGLVHLTHHIGISGSLAYESSAVMKEIEQMLADSARWGQEPVDTVIRSHRHRNIEVRLRFEKERRFGFITGAVTAGWQARTPFAFRTTARYTSPHIGGTLVRSGDQDVYTRHCIWTLPRPKVEDLKYVR